MRDWRLIKRHAFANRGGVPAMPIQVQAADVMQCENGLSPCARVYSLRLDASEKSGAIFYELDCRAREKLCKNR